MKTLNLGIELNQNTDFSLIISIKNQNGPVDITGYSFKSQMRPTTAYVTPTPSTPTAEFQFTILNQTTNKGQVKWFLPAASSAETVIPASVATPLTNERQTTPFVFDVKMKDTSNIISRIIQGIIYLSPEATQESV